MYDVFITTCPCFPKKADGFIRVFSTFYLRFRMKSSSSQGLRGKMINTRHSSSWPSKLCDDDISVCYFIKAIFWHERDVFEEWEGTKKFKAGRRWKGLNCGCNTSRCISSTTVQCLTPPCWTFQQDGDWIKNVLMDIHKQWGWATQILYPDAQHWLSSGLHNEPLPVCSLHTAYNGSVPSHSLTSRHTMVVGPITEGDETAYREEVQKLAKPTRWCWTSGRILLHYRLIVTAWRVSSYMFLGVHIANDLTRQW